MVVVGDRGGGREPIKYIFMKVGKYGKTKKICGSLECNSKCINFLVAIRVSCTYNTVTVQRQI